MRRDTSSLRIAGASYDVGIPVVVVVALVFAVIDRAWIWVAIIALAGVAWGVIWFGTSSIERDVDELLRDLPDELSEPTEAMLAVDALDEAIHGAAGVPFTDQVRLDRRPVDDMLGTLRTALPSGSAALLGELDQLIQRAKPIPLTQEVRVDREAVYDILDRMRASFADGE
jgi:hypothetical protein